MADKYRVKPLIVEVMGPLDYDNFYEIARWCGGTPTANSLNPGVIIETFDGFKWAELGDYVVNVLENEFYPYKPDVFKKTYEPVT